MAREMVFRDHHWFSAGDLEAITRAPTEAGADLIVTTEKDATRLVRARSFLSADDGDASSRPGFVAWIAERLRAAREQRGIAA